MLTNRNRFADHEATEPREYHLGLCHALDNFTLYRKTQHFIDHYL